MNEKKRKYFNNFRKVFASIIKIKNKNFQKVFENIKLYIKKLTNQLKSIMIISRISEVRYKKHYLLEY